MAERQKREGEKGEGKDGMRELITPILWDKVTPLLDVPYRMPTLSLHQRTL